MTGDRFEDEDFQYALEVALGAAHRGASDVGEVLATAARIRDGDPDSWLREWTATAGSAWGAAGAAHRAGRRVSARSHYLRASTYYATAGSLIAVSSEPEREVDLWRRQRDCWDRAVELFPVPAERIAIPYGRGALPGYFFRAPDAAPGEPRPLVVLNNGSDRPTAHMWTLGGAAAGERGHHWMTFDGPGQQAALVDQGLAFRPDWEAVLTPVADAMVARADVDRRRMAVIGICQAGYWVPRALAFEHRFAAAVADPGIVDVSTSWTDHLPAGLRAQLASGDRHGFDREMHLAALFSPAMAARLRCRGAPYGLDGGSPYALYARVARYRLGEEVDRIATPLLITEPEDEQFWPGQSQQLFDRLRGPRELMRFSSADGSGRHCEPLSGAVRETRIFDWLDGYLT